MNIAGTVAHAMHPHRVMATAHYEDFDVHTQAGARWLAPFSALFLVLLIGLIVMLATPYVSSAL